jgi:hypothetical protein
MAPIHGFVAKKDSHEPENIPIIPSETCAVTEKAFFICFGIVECDFYYRIFSNRVGRQSPYSPIYH